ncbi:MAG: phage antirepressor KilAC domain-containing protein [Pseudomonas sp.]
MNTISTASNNSLGVTRLPIHGGVSRHMMSSSEIASLTEKAHKHVIRDIREMVADLEKDGPVLGHLTEDKDSRGYTVNFHLDRELTDTLLTGYSARMRRAVIRRWHELEGQGADAERVPTTFLEAMRLATDQVEQNQKLKLVILQQIPKIEALNRLASTRGSLCITDAAKHLGVSPLEMFAWMSKNRWIYRRTSHAPWSAFQPRLSRGQLEHKLVKINKSEADELKVVEQVMVTRLGLVALAEQISGASS